jgi:F-type H+-transporting ATPase subunit a
LQSPLEQFIIKPIIPLHLGGYDVSFTQSSLWMVVAVVLTVLLMTLSVRGRSLVPGRWQNIAEMLYEVVFGLTDEYLHAEGRKYFPFVFTLFMIVLMGNLLGLIPYSFTYTSHIIVTGALALFVFGMATLVGIWKHKLHFFSLFLPSGLPMLMIPLIIPIEIISYLSRPLSLSVRLCANMMMGHTMLKLIAAFCASLVFLSVSLKLIGIVPFVVNTALTGLELLIAFIQAYVFAILTCIYLRDAIELH